MACASEAEFPLLVVAMAVENKSLITDIFLDNFPECSVEKSLLLGMTYIQRQGYYASASYICMALGHETEVPISTTFEGRNCAFCDQSVTNQNSVKSKQKLY